MCTLHVLELALQRLRSFYVVGREVPLERGRRRFEERLRRIAPEAMAALNELFAAKASLTTPGEPATTWTFRPATTLELPAAILRGEVSG